MGYLYTDAELQKLGIDMCCSTKPRDGRYRGCLLHHIQIADLGIVYSPSKQKHVYIDMKAYLSELEPFCEAAESPLVSLPTRHEVDESEASYEPFCPKLHL